jgi:branched-chain amino acid transport system permease protein
VILTTASLLSNILGEDYGRTVVRATLLNDALRPTAALVLFAFFALLAYAREIRRSKLGAQDKTKTETQNNKWTAGRIFQLVLIAVFLIMAPWLSGRFLSQVLFTVGFYIMMGLGLNIVVGFAGLLDLGYVAFFAFGAYTMGILTTATDLNVGGLNFWTALPFVVVVSVLTGLILGFPVLRMRGDYLAIVTLGFGEIIRILFLSDWLGPIMGGAQGVLKIPNPVIFGISFDSPELMYYLPLIGALVAGYITIRLRESRLGRQWMAMREDEDVAEAMGINLVQTKLLAFAIGAGFSGLGGAFFAARLSNIFPHSFNLLISVNILALIIVGGLGSIPGVIIGALVLVGMPELLREFEEYRLLMYGLLLIVMMLTKPEGFLPAETIRRELHAGEEELQAEA